MGLSSYGNYKNVKLKDPFVLIFNNENGLPVIIKDMDWEMNEATEKVNGYWCWLEIQQNAEKKLSIEELSDN